MKRIVPVILFLILIALIALVQDTVLYFCAAAILLVVGLWYYRARFVAITENRRTFQSLAGFAETQAARNRGRSLLCIGLVASTTFLILSIGAFRLDPEASSGSMADSTRFTLEQVGSGGFSFLGETTFPVYQDIGTPQGREELGIQDSENQHLAEQGFEALAFRVRDGDNAGCLNLYQSGSPRILGGPENISGPWRFAKGVGDDPWGTLKRPISTDADGRRRVPIVLDANTAMYALHLSGKLGEVYELSDGQGNVIKCEVVGLLSNSILQGEILMGEKNLLELFPETSGYRFFLFRCGLVGSQPRSVDDASVKILYELLGEHGFQGEESASRLRKLFAVQNTYLSTFQSLGGIGLLLGVFGLAVIQVRNVVQRRKELAVMRAMGFAKSRVMLVLLYESFSLLFKGLGLACLASLVALFPFWTGIAVQSAGDPVSIGLLFFRLLGTLILVGLVSNLAAAGLVLCIPIAKELAEEH